jgi:YD repeat-containing protein
MTDPNNVVTKLAYDPQGRLTTVTIDPGSNQAVTAIEYDAAGDITKITRPNGAFLQYTWDDARRLTWVTDNTGAYIRYVRDALGGITARWIVNTAANIVFSQSATFDELGRLLTAVGAGGQTWQLGYDKTDNLTAVTDPRTNVYGQAFDSLNRLIGATDEDGAVVTLTRNGKDEITAYTDPRLLATSYIRDGFGEVIQRTSPDSGTTVYVYSAAGKVTQLTDARGVVTNMSYDNAGRLRTKTFPANPVQDFTLTWDQTTGGNKGIGRLTTVLGQNGNVVRTYDTLGQVSKETKVLDGVAYAVSYAHDGGGNVTQMTYPAASSATAATAWGASRPSPRRRMRQARW